MQTRRVRRSTACGICGRTNGRHHDIQQIVSSCTYSLVQTSVHFLMCPCVRAHLLVQCKLWLLGLPPQYCQTSTIIMRWAIRQAGPPDQIASVSIVVALLWVSCGIGSPQHPVQKSLARYDGAVKSNTSLAVWVVWKCGLASNLEGCLCLSSLWLTTHQRVIDPVVVFWVCCPPYRCDREGCVRLNVIAKQLQSRALLA